MFHQTSIYKWLFGVPGYYQPKQCTIKKNGKSLKITINLHVDSRKMDPIYLVLSPDLPFPVTSWTVNEQRKQLKHPDITNYRVVKGGGPRGGGSLIFPVRFPNLPKRNP